MQDYLILCIKNYITEFAEQLCLFNQANPLAYLVTYTAYLYI